MATTTTARMLRLSISHYKSEAKTEAECHKFATEDHCRQGGCHPRQAWRSDVRAGMLRCLYPPIRTSPHVRPGKLEIPRTSPPIPIPQLNSTPNPQLTFALLHGLARQYHTPSSTRKVLEAMNAQRNRGWVIDDHDITVEFYFRDFDALTAVGQEPQFQKLQVEEGPYVNRAHTVASLGWVEVYV